LSAGVRKNPKSAPTTATNLGSSTLAVFTVKEMHEFLLYSTVASSLFEYLYY